MRIEALGIPAALALLVAGLALAAIGVPVAFAVVVAVAVFVLVVVAVNASADRLALALAGLFALTLAWNGIRVGSLALSNPLLFAGFAAIVPLLLWQNRPISLPLPCMLAGVGLLIAAYLTLVHPPDPHLLRDPGIPPRSDLSALAKFETAWLIVPLVMGVVATTPRRIRGLMDLWTLSALVSAAVAIVDYAGVIHLATQPIAGHRSSGLTLHPNYLSFNSALAIPLAMSWMTREDPRWKRAGAIAVGILLGGVLASGSRSASLSAVIALGGMLVAVPSFRKKIGSLLPAAGLLLIFVLAFTHAGHQVIHQLRLDPGNATAVGSDTQRNLGAQIALTQFGASPVHGVGFAWIEDAHNIYLQLLAAGGLIALVSFACYALGLVSAAQLAVSGPMHNEAIAASVAVVVWLLGGWVNNELADKFLYVVPGLLFAMANLSAQSARSRERQRVRVPFARGSPAAQSPR